MSTAAPANDQPAAGDTGDTPGEATLLVSEFPPPPFYYTEAATLQPPEIPKEALERGTRKAAANAARGRAEAERQRLAEDGDQTGALLGGIPSAAEEEDEEGDVVGVFGEIVEDPLLVQPLDPCEDPTVIRDEVKRLNRKVVQGFVHMVQDLVQRPAENKKQRDELSHNVFLMIQEANKFREHQSREILIQLLDQQLAERQKLIAEMQGRIDQADALLRSSPGDGSEAMDES